MKNFNVKNPLSIIAIFSTITEGLCIYVLPKLTPANQDVFIWFVIGFPVLLILLFFYTLINHHLKLYAPADFEKTDNKFAEIFLGSGFTSKGDATQHELSTSTKEKSFSKFKHPENSEDSQMNEHYIGSIDFANALFARLDSILPKDKIEHLWYEKINPITYTVTISVGAKYAKSANNTTRSFALLIFESSDGRKLSPILAGTGLEHKENDQDTIKLYMDHIIGRVLEMIK